NAQGQPTGAGTPPSGVTSPPPFNVNTISRGVSTSDFYLAVPTAIIRFLESDNKTKLIAKPQLRGAEGYKLTLKLGESFPVISTSYTPLATGGPGQNPLNSYNYKDLGVNMDITPRVTLEGDILLDMTVENTAQSRDVTIANATYPAFSQRSVSTKLRLRDGESNLLAGLLQETSRNNIQGFPGAIRVPILKQLFSGNTQTIDQTDIVIVLTPHIIRTHEVTERDLKAVFIGSQGVAGATLAVGGAPPLIQQPEPPPPAPTPTPTPAPGVYPTPGGVLQPPPGTSPVPALVLTPPTP